MVEVQVGGVEDGLRLRLRVEEVGELKGKVEAGLSHELVLGVTFSLRLRSSLKRVSSDETTSQLCIFPFSCDTEKKGGTWLRKEPWLYLIPTTVCSQSKLLSDVTYQYFQSNFIRLPSTF